MLGLVSPSRLSPTTALCLPFFFAATPLQATELVPSPPPSSQPHRKLCLRITCVLCAPQEVLLPTMRGLKRLSFAKAAGNKNLDHWLIIRARGSSSAGRQRSRTGCRRVSRQERCTMVEGFVEKYKMANAGKFPSASLTREQVGGSFYTIKNLIQELQYKSKHSLLNQNAGSNSGEPLQKNSSPQCEKQSPLLMDSKDVSASEPLPSSTSEQFSGSEINLLQVRNSLENHESISMKIVTATRESCPDSDHDIGRDWDKCVTTNLTSKIEETVGPSEASDHETVSTSGFVCTPSDHAESSGDESVRQKTSAESKAEIVLEEMQREKMHQHPSINVPKSTGYRDAHESAGSAEPPQSKKQSLWSNLKSVANGILNFWKKL